ncbi:hypothetical protein BC830DRAFT_1146907, partial [Chytriomyces sp. MP71]
MHPDHHHHHHQLLLLQHHQHAAHEQPTGRGHQNAIERPRGPKANIASSALAATASGDPPRSTLARRRTRGSLPSHSRSYSRSYSNSHSEMDSFPDLKADASRAMRVLRLAQLCQVQTQHSPAFLHSFSYPDQHKENNAMQLELEMPQPRRPWSRVGFDLLPLFPSATTTILPSLTTPVITKATSDNSCFHYRQNYAFSSMQADADSVPDFTHDYESEFADDAATDSTSDAGSETTFFLTLSAQSSVDRIHLPGPLFEHPLDTAFHDISSHQNCQHQQHQSPQRSLSTDLNGIETRRQSEGDMFAVCIEGILRSRKLVRLALDDNLSTSLLYNSKELFKEAKHTTYYLLQLPFLLYTLLSPSSCPNS